MKKLLVVMALMVISLGLSGCLRRDYLEDVTIYTTIFPVEFLTQILYGNHSEVLSIYPDGVDVNEHSLTDHQIREFSRRSAIFVFNGQRPAEREYARRFINNNHSIRIIDVAYGLRYRHGVEELWLSPSNFLMLATNIRNNLQSYITSRYIIEDIEDNFINRLQVPLAFMDANLRRIGRNSQTQGNNTIIASCAMFRFLENYGFNVIVLDEESLSPAEITEIRNNFRNDTFRYIFIRSDEVASEFVESFNAEIMVFNTMQNISDEERRDNETYFTFMNINIENIRLATVGS